MNSKWSLARLSASVQLHLFMLCAVAATFAFWYSVDRPIQARIAASASTLEELRRRTASSASGQRLAELREQLATLQGEMSRRGSVRSPGHRNAADLLRVLDEQATDADLIVIAFRPKSSVGQQPVAEPAIALELEGTYHDFAVFLDRVRALGEQVFVSAVSMRAKQPPEADGTLDIACTVTTSSASAAPGSSPPGFTLPMAVPYVYDAAGRRDPFISLLSRDAVGAVAPTVAHPRGDGLAGISIDEVVVKGTAKSLDAWLGMVGLPNGRTYFVRAGDRLMDGQVAMVTRTAIVFIQDPDPAVGRPTALEVRKQLRAEMK